jgi:hypothetical protein
MNTLEQRVLELVGEDPDAPDVFTDDDEGMAPIRQSISDAVAEIAMLTGGFRRTYYLPLREDTAFYRMRLQYGDVGWITDVWSTNRKRRLEQTDFTRLTHHDPRWMVHRATPEAYIPIGQDVIGFYPAPSGSSDVIEIKLVEIPSTYESARDRIKLRDAFQFACVNYAVAEFWASRGDAEEATAHMQRYLDALNLRQDYMQQAEQVRGTSTHKDPWPTVST